jgi:hypothetical protein
MPVAERTQEDVGRESRLSSYPSAVAAKAGDLQEVTDDRDKAVADLRRLEAQHPEWVSPTTMQRVGYAMRFSVYPANVIAEVTAGAPTALFLARTFGVPEGLLWIAPMALAGIVLAGELGVAHARDDGRDRLTGRAPFVWTIAALGILLALVGAQIVSQTAAALTPLPSEPARTLSDLTWIDWGRTAFAVILLGTPHLIVLFGGRGQLESLGFVVFRVKRRRLIWQEARLRRNRTTLTRDLGLAVNAFQRDRDRHAARGFTVEPAPAYDEVTVAVLNRFARDAARAAAGETPASNRADGAENSGDASRPPAPTPPGPRPTDPAPTREPSGGDAEAEVDYYRRVLDARVREEDAEVRAPAR